MGSWGNGSYARLFAGTGAQHVYATSMESLFAPADTLWVDIGARAMSSPSLRH